MVMQAPSSPTRSAPSLSISSGYDACVRCGLCLPSCPTYLETMTETSGPRGRISLIKAVDEGRIDLLSPGFVEQMSQCLDCRACEAVCPSGVPYGHLLETMRARIEAAGAPARPQREQRIRSFFLRRALADMGLMRRLAAFARIVQRLHLRWTARFFGFETLANEAPALRSE